MDSLSQLVLGACCLGFAAPPQHRRAALVLGAAVGTLPDMDVLINYGGAIENFTMHRGFSHSLLLLPWVGLLLHGLLLLLWRPARAQAWRWLLAIELALLTHPVLDAFTIYGTQLWWPLTSAPVAIGSVFIIDPLYTLPLLVAALWVFFKPQSRNSLRLLGGALLLSSAYLGWSLLAQAHVERTLNASIRSAFGADAKTLVVPMPLNTLLWRVLVVRSNGDYAEGFYSLLNPSVQVRWQNYLGQSELLDALATDPRLKRLKWFTHGFLAAEQIGAKVVIKDLRMGAQEAYVFRFVLAERMPTGETRPVPAEQLAWPTRGSEMLSDLWLRLFEPNAGQ